MHASTGEDMTWINSHWDCGSKGHDDGKWEGIGGQAFRMHAGDYHFASGAWCDAEITELNNFICEGIIFPQNEK